MALHNVFSIVDFLLAIFVFNPLSPNIENAIGSNSNTCLMPALASSTDEIPSTIRDAEYDLPPKQSGMATVWHSDWNALEVEEAEEVVCNRALSGCWGCWICGVPDAANCDKDSSIASRWSTFCSSDSTKAGWGGLFFLNRDAVCFDVEEANDCTMSRAGPTPDSCMATSKSCCCVGERSRCSTLVDAGRGWPGLLIMDLE